MTLRYLPRPRARVRARTESMDRLSVRELAAGRVHLQWLADEGIVERRPTTRGECVDGERPCPWVSCRHHLSIEVKPRTGAIMTAFPDLELEAHAETCSLDVADRGEHTLEQVAQLIGCVRERARQIEEQALGAIRLEIDQVLKGNLR